MSTLALLPTLALYNDAYLRSLAMFEDIGTRAVEMLGGTPKYHAGAISYRPE